MSSPLDRVPGADPAARELSPHTARLLWATFLALAVAAGVAIVPLPYAILSPGPATNTLGKDPDGKPLIEILDTPTYPTSGALDFTTVRVSGGPGRRVNAWDLLGAWASPDREVFPEDSLFPEGTTSEQVRERNEVEMTGSQREATAVALRSVGQRVGVSFVVSAVTEDAPAAGVIEPGDVITAVDGNAVRSIADIQDRVQAGAAGEAITLRVRRGGREQQLRTTTMQAGGRTVLGVRLRLDYDLPYEVVIHAGEVGGPSAGTMFALAIRDLLTPGAMTGGKRIAGTGTIDDAGTVGQIGGVRQKIVGAREAGADFFLTPAGNCPDLAGENPGRIKVVRIATFDEAVAAVRGIAAGEKDLPTCG